MTTPDVPAGSGLTVPITRRVSPLVVIAAVVSCLLIGAAALVASLFAPNGRDSSIIVAFVMGTVAPTAVGLLALIRGDHAAQLGAANAKRLTDTAEVVAEVADHVNGHLARHDALAESVAQVAETVAAAAGVPVQMPRDPATRTRAADVAAGPGHPPAGPAATTGPLADQT